MRPISTLIIVMLIVLATSSPSTVNAQPSAGAPLPDVFRPTDADLPIDAFMFLSESGSQVVVPGTTWEQLEKLKQANAGDQSDRGHYVFQSLTISGLTKNGRAEMDVVIKLNVEPTEGRFMKIPLGMSNFHRLGDAKVFGIKEHAMVVAGDGSGYQLWVRTDAACKARVSMKVSARVETTPANSMSFQLPDVPSTVTIDVDTGDVLGDVVSGADEVITSKQIDSKTTRLEVESNGGNFLVRWANRLSATAQMPLLEVESRVDIRWDSPQDQPIASVRLTARNVKGSIERFQLLLPPGSVLLDTPRLGMGGQAIQFIPVDSKTKPPLGMTGDLVSVVIPKEEQQQRIDLNFELQLTGGEITAETPLLMTVPRVVDSLRHRGELSIRLEGSYRLRWESQPWIRSEIVNETDQNSNGRLYRFRFDRGSFELPIWLSTKERRLTLSVQSEVIIRDATASLQMQINVGGSVASNQLHMDDESWDILSIIDQDTGQQVETFMMGDERVIQWGQPNRQDNLVLLLTAQRPLGQDLGSIEFPLPRINTNENEVVAGESTFDLVGNGRTLMTVDLAASEGLTRIMTSESENATGATLSRFRLAGFGEPVNVVGMLQDQPLRITLASNATLEIDGSQILSTVDWTIDSPLDLEGRLPIRIPSRRIEASLFESPLLDSEAISGLLPRFFGQSGQDPTSQDDRLLDRENVFGRATESSDQWAESEEPWIVTVDNVPATLRKLDNDRFELISERLASGTMEVRWRHEQEIVTSNDGKVIQQVAFPRPQIPDLTMRGNFEVKLRGDGRSDLVAMQSPGSFAETDGLRPAGSSFSETQFLPSSDVQSQQHTHYLVMDALPREPIRLQLKTQSTDLQDLSIEQLVLRTAIGHQTRQEQVLATIRRGSEFRVFVFDAAATEERDQKQVKVEAMVDGDPVSVENRQGWLVIELPGDQDSHSLELNVWVEQESFSSIMTVRPLVRLPAGIGRVFWQVITPLDSHVVWASPTVGRAMSWQFDRWRLYRQTSLSDQQLANLVKTRGNSNSGASSPPGNRYLYVGTDLPAFEVAIASRTVLWIIVASTVLLLSVLLTYLPSTRHPLTAVFCALMFAGLIVIAPDAAVLAGQLGMISLVLVIVMMAIRSLLVPGRNDRVFASSSQPRSDFTSTRIIRSGQGADRPASSIQVLGEISETRSMRPPGSPPSGAEISS
jgi:hypothetical protein